MSAREYGTIVIGAGSAGAAAAGRLAEGGDDVLLIESGDDWRSEDCRPDVRFPRRDVFAWKAGLSRSTADLAWPGLVAQRLPGGDRTPYRRGRGVGGTSAINGLVAIRPPMEEFDDWEQQFGCTGWGSADVLPYFARLEDDTDFWPEEYHGRGGPIPVTRLTESHFGTADHLLRSAAQAIGHPWDPDVHRPGFFGVSLTPMNTRFGARVTTNDGYLEPVRTLENFAMLASTTALSLIMAGTRAVGVRVRREGAEHELRASRVVVCGGSAMSPALLQRSGIGPGDLLRELGIPVIADLPVGVGMQDHAGYWLATEFADTSAGAGSRGNMTLRWSSGLDGSGAGDLLAISANPLDEEPTMGALGVKLAQCFSRGSLRITSAAPDENPEIDLGLLTDERDVVLARRSVRDALDLLTTPCDGPRVVAVRDRHGAEVSRAMDDSALDEWMRSVVYDTSHLSGGCAIGSVVDPSLRALGIDGLWVADLSVVPTVPRANTHLTAVMIGERVADLLLDDSNRKDN